MPAKILPLLRYYASHAAAFGGVATALALFLTGNSAAGLAALVGALGGFGLAIKPA